MTTTFQPKPGDIVYDGDGSPAVYIGRSADLYGHIVQMAYSRDGDPVDVEAIDEDTCSFSGPITLREIHAEPPVAALNAEVAALRAQAREAESALRDIKERTDKAAYALRTVELQVKQNPQLHDLGLWMAGKVTHAAILGSSYSEYSGVRIGPVPDIFKKSDFSYELRLVSLFYDSTSYGNYHLGVNQYCDGSGNDNRRVFLATSAEEALSKVAQHFAVRLKGGNLTDGHAIGFAEWLVDHGFSNLVGEQLLQSIELRKEKARHEKVANTQRNLEHAEKQAAAYRQQLESLRAPEAAAS